MSKNKIMIRSSTAEYLTFVATTGGGNEAIEMKYEDENIWLTQKLMATLYNVDVRTINEHIKKIYNDNELTEDSTIQKFRIVQIEGNREVKYYNLDAVISVGYRVNSDRAIQFRRWTTYVLREIS